MQSQALGHVLVIGGCGFMGHHLVKALLDDSDVEHVSVFSRSPRENRYPEASYYAGDITSVEEVTNLLKDIQPRIIFHAASPDPYQDPPNHLSYQKVNVEGTKNLLACASSAPSVVALVYTSSLTIYKYDVNGEIFNADESHPILNGPVTKYNPYSESKALADALVLAANNPSSKACHLAGKCSHSHLRTACIRISGIYGEGDENMTMLGLQLAHYGLSFLQLGDNTTLFDPIYVSNAVFGHVLAAKALLTEVETDIAYTKDRDEDIDAVPPKPRICGEAFNITDDLPSPFWFYMRKFYTAAGHPPKTIWVIPTWILFMLAWLTEYWFWIVYQGRRRPKILIRSKLEYLCMTRTYQVSKAKQRLGWYALVGVDEAAKNSMRWGLAKLGVDVKNMGSVVNEVQNGRTKAA
ncbi:hypothetical protein BELL_0071g00080 [Botrytis elliptica]|uniref:3-beta hydroxysteroid dehydrogenase/isomerase domain-containing protein n=1 Tax=Botrytis elliptica TaxID=278938 RepID=A0A4Z1JXN0_9HELO|nr:hypothetical protein EAE99_011829 [Botrytis elliptica]TGO78288.1 hypothetical protein BELL_0071g00080 [Botrytis elliptica]